MGAGRANEGLRANWQEQLQCVVKECGFKYLRFHGLFHDDMFVYRETEGNPIYNFQYIDDLIDRMLEMGIRPFVELGFAPDDLAGDKKPTFWWGAHGVPPNDPGKWAGLVRETVLHWIARYEIEEVKKWYFEVWNEPNLSFFFRGTKSQYFELYKITAQTIKAIDASLRVGGPATSNFVPDDRFAGDTEDTSCHRKETGAADLDALEWRPVWVNDFLEFCRQNELPVDFISTHPYPTDWALDAQGVSSPCTREVDSTRKDLELLRRIVDASPYPDAGIHLTEWSSSPSPRDFTHDYLQAATFVVKSNLESAGLVDSMAYWTFTDVFEEHGAGDTLFHGGFGMINFQGVVKPTFHAYRFLHALGDELLCRAPGGVVTRDRRTGRHTAIAWHYPREMSRSVPASFHSRDVADRVLGMGESEALTVELADLKPGVQVLVETLGQGNGDAMSAWKSMGQPDAPTREQTRLLRQAAEATKQEHFTVDENGRFRLDRTIAPWNIVLIREL